MAIKSKSYVLTTLLGGAMLFSAGTPAQAQTQQVPTTPSPMPVSPVSPPPRLSDNINEHEVAEFNQFLDVHQEIAEQLRKDPSLIDNHQFVADHPELQQFLQAHPRITASFRANPNLFMGDEGRYNHDVSDMARFLDTHPEVAEQLRKDPSLIDNPRFVSDHPELQQYLQAHPQIAAAFRADPNAFMQGEDRDDIDHHDVADMASFLASHREIAEQLRKDPGLIDNRQWVSSHPALQEYLQQHPQLTAAFRDDPSAFMRDVERYDHQNGYTQQAGMGDRNHGELNDFGRFLGSHAALATELQRDPTLATSKEYLSTHPELDQYLKAHPTVGHQLSTDPQGVMSSNWVQDSGGFKTKPTSPMSKP